MMIKSINMIPSNMNNSMEIINIYILYIFNLRFLPLMLLKSWRLGLTLLAIYHETQILYFVDSTEVKIKSYSSNVKFLIIIQFSPLRLIN